MSETRSEITSDAFLGGLVTLLQPRRGFRAGLDAALLQAGVPANAAGLAVDLGSGAGTIALCLAARAPGLRCIGIERDPGQVALADAALRLPANASFADRVRFMAGEIGPELLARGDAEIARGAADWVLMNPPFDKPGEVRASPHGGKRAAFLAEHGTLGAWMDFANALLRRGGHLLMIHRTAALPRLLAALTRFGDIRVLPVHPRQGEEARRVLVAARSGRRGPLRILPALVLHEESGGWTSETDSVLTGKAALRL